MGLLWKTNFTDQRKLLYSKSDGDLDTSSTSLDYINGLQANMDAVGENIPNKNTELRSSVGRFYGTNTSNIESGSNPYSSIHGRGLIIGGRCDGNYANSGQITTSDTNSLTSTGVVHIEADKKVDVDGSVSNFNNLTVYGLLIFM